MPRRKRYKGRIEFVVPGAYVYSGGNLAAMVTMEATEPPYDGYIDMPTCVLFDRPEIFGVTPIPRAVWFDDNISREAAELYGVIKSLHLGQSEVLKGSDSKETFVINRPMLEGWLGVPRRTIQAWLQELIDTGHVTRELARRGIESNYRLNSE
ncbi:MAG: hypothetical protein H0V86_09070 [Chloroflexia bacterium]|nr:hypothetical protein [Chloroflexia bacterium]